MDFCEQVEALLQSKDYRQLESLIFDPEHQERIQLFGMDLITRVCECGIAFCNDFDSTVFCQDVLMHIAKTARPKEALIGLLEQAEILVSADSDKFVSLLPPLQHVMFNLPSKREHSFSWVLSILNSHIKAKHKFPKELKSKFLRGKEAFVMEESELLRRTILTYKQFCNFYEPFIAQFYNDCKDAYTSEEPEEAKTEAICRQQSILRDHLVQLLGDPLLHFDLSWTEQDTSGDGDASTTASAKNLKTDARQIAELLMGFLVIVDQHPEHWLEWANRKVYLEKSKLKNKPIYCGDDDESDCEDVGNSDLFVVDFGSVVNYLYLIYVEGLNSRAIPGVLSTTYVFLTTTRLMSTILNEEKPGPIPLLKCMLLSQKVLDRLDESVPGLRLEAVLLETAFASEYIESVAFHTVYCETLEVRKAGLQVLRQILWKFDPKGRYDFIVFVLNRIEHDGVKGFMITQLKDCIRQALDKDDAEMKEYFTGKFLLSILRLTCALKHGVTTDLMDNKEQIMSALNLVLYLAIRDKQSNLTGIHDVLPEIEKNLLEPLFRGLELSRAHYQLKLKELEDPQTLKMQAEERKKLAEGALDVVLNEDALTPENMTVPLVEQKRAVNSALWTFDIMNGTLARVNEVCNILQKSVQKS